MGARGRAFSGSSRGHHREGLERCVERVFSEEAIFNASFVVVLGLTEIDSKAHAAIDGVILED